MRSDTGHFMTWPSAQSPAVALPAPVLRSRTPSIDLDHFVPARPVPLAGPVEAPGARAVVTSTSTDRGTLAVTLFNWMFLLGLFCTFLLAATAGSGASAG